MNPRIRLRLGGLCAVLVLLFLVLALTPQPAYLQEPSPPAESSAPSDVDASADPVPASDAAVQAIDCSTPPSGRQAKLRAESEIVIAHRWNDSSDGLRYSVFDRSDNGLQSVVYNLYRDALPNIRWPAITTADLNGDGRPEAAIAFRNQYRQLSVLVPPYGDQPGDYWVSIYDRHRGYDVDYIDVAAGNLDRSADGDDELVIAFSDNQNDIHLVGLDGDSGGGIQNPTNTWSWIMHNNDEGRGNVAQVSIAAGDVDGDGYDNESAVAFVDGNNDLQVMIFQHGFYPDNSSPLFVWGKAWSNLNRGNLPYHYIDDRLVDVATGDVDGDFQDEVIVALKDGYSDGHIQTGKVQLLVLDNTGNWSFNDLAYVQIDPTEGYTLGFGESVNVEAVSVAASDIDGDGKDEVSVAYDLYVNEYDSHTYPHLVTFDYDLADLGGLGERDGSHWRGEASPWDKVSLIHIASGDIDMDGRAEIVMAFQDRNQDMQLLVFEGEDGLTKSRSYLLGSSVDTLGEFWIAMGDVDGDSSYANYTGTCHETQETQVTAVLHVPPHYSAYNRTSGGTGSAAGLGKFIGSGGSNATGTTTKNAGSVTVDTSVSFADIFEVGPSFTYEYEHSLQTSNEYETKHTEELHTATDAGAGIFDLVAFDRVTYWVYEYSESRSGHTFELRIPKGYTASSRRLDLWYSNGPSEFGNSWVPVGQNLARGRTATQSSTGWGGTPDRAVDGNADGDYYNNSVSHTLYEQYPWWQVDLGRIQWLDAIRIWNRTDAYPERLSNFYVFVSDAPFASTNPDTLKADPNVWHYHVSGQGGRPTMVTPNRSGRYVRVQLAGTNYLLLAEVQVYGHPAEVKDATGNRQWPTERPTALGDDAFQVKLPDGTDQTVDGHLQWAWTATNGIQVDRGAGPGAWETQDDEEWTTSVETSTAHSLAWGFEAKVMGAGVEGAYTHGSETRTSREYSWSRGTVVEGQAGPLIYETTPAGISYNYSPYIWIQKTQSTSGVPQEFMVVDYWVSTIGLPRDGDPGPPAATSGITPLAPIVDSSSHPDPATWYPTNTVDLAWAQPPGDPATVAGYRWYMDGEPDTVPGPIDKGLSTSHTYEDVPDGLWYAHVRAVGDGGEWSETGHRAVRVDANPPQVTLSLDPPEPTGNSDWYKTPLTVTASASDGAGSGVSTVEVSTDGTTWQPYSPLLFDTDTPTTTVWARATDAVGHTSEPVSTTFKIDVTPPSSKIQVGEYTIGVWLATVVTDTLGNQSLVLGGVIDDDLSGRAGMAIQANGGDWTSASKLGAWHPFASQPQIEVNWYYTATTELGRGNHIFYGQAQDEAGNLEEPYQIAQVIWFPPSTPDLSASSLAVSPQVARPGDEVTFVVAARNSGQQEAQVEMVDTLPAGLAPVAETLGYGVTYDPGAGTITWPARLLWPGQWSRVSFRAKVEATNAGILENQVTAHAFWPNTDALSDPARRYFADREDTAVMTATLTVDPDLPAGADVTPPQAGLGIVGGLAVVTQPQVELEIRADADARSMFVREWTPDPFSGAWTVAQESGWISYVPTMTWTLSPGDGVKYLGVWVADGAHNVSLLDEGSLTYTNLVGSNQSLPDGGRTQYRFEMDMGDLAAFYVTTLAGNADLYMWKPQQAFRPNYWSNGPGGAGTGDEIIEWLDEGGRYLLEVQAVGDSQYQLTIADESLADIENRTSQAHLLSFAEKDRPQHPLTISDPLSAGQAGALPGLAYEFYLPVVAKNG
jgi:uncharacterized repeat protein (TIGR01451 family)